MPLLNHKVVMTTRGLQVIFHGPAVQDYVEVQVEDDGSITIRGFDGRLAVYPEVANKVNVKLEKRGTK